LVFVAMNSPIRLLQPRKINIPLPFTDFRPIIKQYTRRQWSDFWSQRENKLQAVQPTLGCLVWSCRETRREEIVLCRLRIGHPFLTHRYLLAGEDPPECISYQEQLITSSFIAPNPTTSENTIIKHRLG